MPGSCSAELWSAALLVWRYTYHMLLFNPQTYKKLRMPLSAMQLMNLPLCLNIFVCRS